MRQKTGCFIREESSLMAKVETKSQLRREKVMLETSTHQREELQPGYGLFVAKLASCAKGQRGCFSSGESTGLGPACTDAGAG
jgi:hypothetical protein